MADANEASLLLHYSRSSSPSPPRSRSSSSSRASKKENSLTPQRIKIILLCGISTLILDVGFTIMTAPKIRIFESILCLQHYRVHDPSLIDPVTGGVPEDRCKIDPVQESIADLVGWQGLWDSLPALLLAVPYGMMSDSLGRKPVLLTSFFGLTLSTAWILFICLAGFPLQWTWFSSIFQCIGGGPVVAAAVIETIIADVVPNEERSTIFFQLQAAVLVSDVIAPPLSSALMTKSPWIPCFIGLSIQALSSILPIALPETLHLSGELSSEGEERVSPAKTSSTSALRQLRKTVTYIFRDPRVAALVTSLLILRIGKQSIELLLQYVSKRYGWSIAKAAMLLSLRASIEFFLLIAVLPALVLTFRRGKISPDGRDLLVARISLLFMVIGFGMIAFASSVIPAIFGLVVYTFGTGFQPAVFSLLASIWKAHDPAHLGSLYSIVAIIVACGGAIAGPLLSQTFNWGLQLGGVWVGLPFLASAGTCAVIGGMLSCFVLE